MVGGGVKGGMMYAILSYGELNVTVKSVRSETFHLSQSRQTVRFTHAVTGPQNLGTLGKYGHG